MLVKTKYFGEIDLGEDKVLYFEKGLFGFEELKRYTILYDSEAEERPAISWLQSLDEPALALPVMNPGLVKPDYNPVVEDETLTYMGEITEDNLILLVTVTVPADITQMTINLKAPIVINADTRKGGQVVAENQDYLIKYAIYDILQKSKQKQ